MGNDRFLSAVKKCLASTALPSRVEKTQAVVLERVARGGGATNWFCCTGKSDLEAIERELLPGSLVSFYFDQRLKRSPFTENLHKNICEIIDKTGECVVAHLPEGTTRMEVDFVSGDEDLQDFMTNHTSSGSFFFGPFPARDNDGINAITVTLPDADGVVRGHPY